ncbi:hypothetical protein [Rhizobium sp. AAP43]|uniref:hypothetical protein n=1 Tax=Rhizobium sp. AAP43 TaxID=1523420 RepID=UPI0006B92114|nr:hypothetical protein [Rhizobium sp. AAP43]KPF43599.1 hypothetical protein IP76_13665 [Rhizobium sp. AAP43]
MRSVLALVAAVAVLACLGGASAALSPAQVENALKAQALDISNLKGTMKNLGDRVTAQGSRTTALTGRVNVVNNTLISVNQKIQPLLKIQPSLIRVPELIDDLAALQAAVQPLLNNRAALLALLTLPAKFANLTSTVDELAKEVKSQNASLAAINVNLATLAPLLDNTVVGNLVSLSTNADSLLSLAPKANALLGLLTIG